MQIFQSGRRAGDKDCEQDDEKDDGGSDDGKMVNHNHWQGFESDDGDDAAATGVLMTSITVLMMMKQMSLTRKY